MEAAATPGGAGRVVAKGRRPDWGRLKADCVWAQAMAGPVALAWASRVRLKSDGQLVLVSGVSEPWGVTHWLAVQSNLVSPLGPASDDPVWSHAFLPQGFIRASVNAFERRKKHPTAIILTIDRHRSGPFADIHARQCAAGNTFAARDQKDGFAVCHADHRR